MDYVLGIIDEVADEFDRFQVASNASGYCRITTEKLGERLDWTDVEMIYTNHNNDPDGRYLRLQQYSDHFALYIPEEGLVLDYTMRQFDPATPFPYVGTVDAWKELLAVAWDVTELHTTTGLLCESCEMVGDRCECCEECYEYLCDCESSLTWVNKKLSQSA